MCQWMTTSFFSSFFAFYTSVDFRRFFFVLVPMDSFSNQPFFSFNCSQLSFFSFDCSEISTSLFPRKLFLPLYLSFPIFWLIVLTFLSVYLSCFYFYCLSFAPFRTFRLSAHTKSYTLFCLSACLSPFLSIFLPLSLSLSLALSRSLSFYLSLSLSLFFLLLFSARMQLPKFFLLVPCIGRDSHLSIRKHSKYFQKAFLLYFISSLLIIFVILIVSQKNKYFKKTVL